MVYLTLFVSAFISATLFPLGSEALFLYDLNEGYNLYFLLLFASIGNILGSCVNYWLGNKGEDYLEKKQYLKQKSIKKYKSFFSRYGAWALLLSWAPIIGDPITFIAGLMKYPFKKFLFFVTCAKFLRYLLLALTYNSL